MAKQKCANCDFLEVERGRDGKRRIFKRYAYRCLCPVKETDADIPYSMARYGQGFFIPGSNNRSLLCSGEDGHSCPRYEPLCHQHITPV